MLVRGSSGAGPALPELGRRLKWVAIVLILFLGALIGRLWQLQVVRGDRYYERTVDNVVQKRFLPSIRGNIVDRNGVPLATNRPAYNIYITPKKLDKATRTELVRLLGLDEEEQGKLDERIAYGTRRDATQPVMVLEDQGETRAQLVDEASYRLPGVEVRHEPYRTYPQGDLAAHVIGYMTQMTEAEYARLGPNGYDSDELVGRYGLEAEWENYLRGKKGVERFAVDARGQRINDEAAAGLIQGERMIEPVAGDDVVLTLDAELQKIAERAVSPHASAAVAIVEVKTGRVLALVSKPSFDPNVMTGHLTRAEKALLDADPRKPFSDKTLAARFPPGSTFKFVTAIAALEDGVANEEEKVECNGALELSGTTFRCTSAHGVLDLLGAIQHSCNIYFWTLAQRIGMDRMAEVAREYGFGAPTGIGLNGDAAGRIPTKAWYEQRGQFKIGNTINAATGQGDVEVTVLQMAMAYAALANGGTLYTPQIVQRVVAKNKRVVVEYEPKVAREIGTPPEVLDVWRQGMWRVVNQPGGTAFEHGHSDIVEIAGKTGTAEVRSRKKDKPSVMVKGWDPKRSHAWFAGWAPANDPQIAIVVLVEHGGPGGKVAAPIAKNILEQWWTKIEGHTPMGTPTDKSGTPGGSDVDAEGD
jgi:penicillin-binding protein 2